MIYDDESVKSLLEKEKEIRKNAGKLGWKWIDKDLETLKKRRRASYYTCFRFILF